MYYEPETKTQKVHILKPRYLEYIIHTYIYIQTNFNISLYYPLNLYRKELKFQFRFFLGAECPSFPT